MTEAADETNWPFTSVRDAFGWWYRPVISSPSWLAFGYLAVGAIWGPLLFVIVVALLALTFSLSIVAVGVLLVVPAFALINVVCSAERHRAAWVGEPIAARVFRKSSPRRSWFSPIATRLVDPERWRQVAFGFVFVVSGPVFFVLGALPWVVALRPTIGYVFNPGPIDFVGVVVAFVLLGAAPRITAAVAGVARSMTAWFLGPDQTAVLKERVDTLSTQREQILDVVSDERQRIERNLHDGVQQQLVALGIDIGMAAAKIDDDPDAARVLLGDARDKVRNSIGELRVIGRGLHPAILEDRGLDAALSSVVGRSSIPISVNVDVDQKLPKDVAATAYYVVNESVANILKHARARVASIHVVDDPDSSGSILITVHDDGRGGADQRDGTGLAGIRARVESRDGHFTMDSPPGGPTTLQAVIPTGRSSAAAQ